MYTEAALTCSGTSVVPPSYRENRPASCPQARPSLHGGAHTPPHAPLLRALRPTSGCLAISGLSYQRRVQCSVHGAHPGSATELAQWRSHEPTAPALAQRPHTASLHGDGGRAALRFTRVLFSTTPRGRVAWQDTGQPAHAAAREAAGASTARAGQPPGPSPGMSARQASSPGPAARYFSGALCAAWPGPRCCTRPAHWAGSRQSTCFPSGASAAVRAAAPDPLRSCLRTAQPLPCRGLVTPVTDTAMASDCSHARAASERSCAPRLLVHRLSCAGQPPGPSPGVSAQHVYCQAHCTASPPRRYACGLASAVYTVGLPVHTPSRAAATAYDCHHHHQHYRGTSSTAHYRHQWHQWPHHLHRHQHPAARLITAGPATPV